MPGGRVCTRDGCADFDACHRAVNDWQGELAFCEKDDMPGIQDVKEQIDWKQYEHLLGTMSDYKIAQQLGCNATTVGYQRHKRNIPAYDAALQWPDHLCECGCGKYTNRADRTDKSQGRIQGKPARFLPHHWNPGFEATEKNPEQRWPDKVCECGCDKITNRATQTNSKAGYRKGQPMRFLSGHWRPNL